MAFIERPPHIEPRRAVAIVDAEGRRFLAVCVRCYQEKYILEKHTVCSDCQTPRGNPFISKSARRAGRGIAARIFDFSCSVRDLDSIDYSYPKLFELGDEAKLSVILREALGRGC
jgi:hypothetical protein